MDLGFDVVVTITGIVLVFLILILLMAIITPVSYTHLTLPTTHSVCRSRWSPYH